MKNHNEKSWTKFPKILKDASFFKEAENVLKEECSDFGKYRYFCECN